jgi:hypothetical protein
MQIFHEFMMLKLGIMDNTNNLRLKAVKLGKMITGKLSTHFYDLHLIYYEFLVFKSVLKELN